jgi:hypothetical protein
MAISLTTLNTATLSIKKISVITTLLPVQQYLHSALYLHQNNKRYNNIQKNNTTITTFIITALSTTTLRITTLAITTPV